MISFVKKFSGIGVNERWFAGKLSFTDSLRLVACMHLKTKKGLMLCVPQYTHTVENDLLKDTKVIFDAFSKTVQIEIKQAQKKMVACSFLTDIKKFENFYNDFAKERNIDCTSEKRLKEIGKHLKITMAEHEGVIVAAHSYLVDGQAGIVRLMHSASLRLAAGADKQLAGRANKLLHYHDMLYFKQNGFAVYDFGGYAMHTKDKGLQGINNFKLSFGGEIVTCKNYFSLPYFIFKKIAAATGRLGRA